MDKTRDETDEMDFVCLPGEQPADDDDEVEEEQPFGQEPCSVVHCGLCTNALDDPVSTPCGHNFCITCLATRLGAESRPSDRVCPVCGKSLKNVANDLAVNMQLKAIVAMLTYLMPEPTTGDALALMLRTLETQPEPRRGLDDPRRVRRVIEAACLSERDLQRLQDYARMLQDRLDQVVARRQLITEGLEGPLRAGWGSWLVPGERDIVATHAVQARARRMFPGLPHDRPYNLIVVPTKTSDYSEAGLPWLLGLPIYGIAAQNTVIIIGCRPCDHGDVVEKVIPAWGATHGALAAVWAEHLTAASPPASLWVAAHIGPVQTLQTRRENRGVIHLRAVPVGDDLPMTLLKDFGRMFPAYNDCCIIRTSQVVPGWKTTEVAPPQ